MSLDQDTVRTILVEKYKYDLEDTSIAETDKTRLENAGLINNLYTATSTVVNYGDPQIEILCELNDNNYRVCQPTYLMYTKFAEGFKENLFTIKSVDIRTSDNTIKVIGEPVANELRNGTTRILGSSIFQADYYADFSYSLIRLRSREAYNTQPIETFTRYRLQTAGKNGLELLGGTEFSALDLYGGQFEKEGYDIRHKRYLGNPDRNYRLKLGVNVRGMSVTLDTSDVVNAVLHYYKYTENNTEKVIYTDPRPNEKLYPFKLGKKELRSGRVLTRDWGQYADIVGQPPPTNTENTIRQKMIEEAGKWNQANAHLNEPKLNIELDFYSLRGKIGFEQYDELLTLKLGDSVLYYHEPLDWEISARVSGFEYNIITDGLDKISIGNGKKTILDRIGDVK